MVTEAVTKLRELYGKAQELQYEENQINTSMIVYKKFNWFQRHIFNRKEYARQEEDRRLYEEKKEEIQARKNQIEEEKGRFTECGISKEAINDFMAFGHFSNEYRKEFSFNTVLNICKTFGIKPVLRSEEDEVRNSDRGEWEGLEQFVWVHKTNYMPRESRLQTPKETGAYHTGVLGCSGKDYEFTFPRGRNTIHYSVNGEVADHDAGEWNDTKYAVLVGAEKVPKEQIRSTLEVDSYIEGGMSIKDGYILCPESEMEAIQEKNPDTIVIGYEGNSVTGYADKMVKSLGYRYQNGGKHSWLDTDTEKILKYRQIMEGLKLPGAIQHANSKEGEQEDYLNNRGLLCSALKTIINSDINIENMDNVQIDFVNKRFNAGGQKMQLNLDTIIEIGSGMEISDTNQFLQAINGFYNELSKIGMEIPQDIKDSIVNAAISEKKGLGNLDRKNLIKTELIDYVKTAIPKVVKNEREGQAKE